ncbi:UDP-3-O-acyl-N-acetylglucosamine deacetylase [Alphaproteobacteria bacterium KMM 3653]|uniref:UDP-3-O-acyl-N-acetylglucosamine deacetylase n=1 Tax=Harenicola maris TaxID=2841044 RepID=A0AAP2G316_9RHOB|nr:UDP-3-O-acyl-N-acetylglucosamine deacetylase [Harenicola maris]
MQTTLKSSVTLRGVGVHKGRAVRMTMHPASANYGIWFKRTDVRGADQLIAARWDNVSDAQLCTLLSNDEGTSVSTVEHVMAALAGCGVHNALIEVSGPEVPIMDGSSAPFVRAIMNVGLQELNAPVRALKVLKPVEVRRGDSVARLEPFDGIEIDFAITFDEAAIGDQRLALNMANGSFVRNLCDSRTFCRKADVDAMHARGLALGGTYRNAVVVEGADVLSPGGLRHRDEPVRHKMLDALGDLALAGAPVMGRYVGARSGHAMTNMLLRALFADPSAYRMVTCDKAMARRLPGVGVTHADLRAVA